ncbi:hypothetical protein BJ878DRAFT_542574 [Calycina marina]|uniref:Uncharacterized protein n=1 Tax=Calycina marina TaxID=1763456 RepID=A0A9P7Z2K9_9HELO|nr:hypothetical protein BJ878DRAFT_542574 [Calycina marina]
MSFFRTLTSASRAAPGQFRQLQTARTFSISRAAFADAPADTSMQSGGAQSKEAKETGSSPTGGEVGGVGVEGSGISKPKIAGDSEPGAGKDEKEFKKEVEQHNKEFEKGHDRAQAATDDKVDKRFWKGQGGHSETGGRKS